MIQAVMDLRAHPHDGDLMRYLDHECDPIEREDIRRHVEGCERCAELLGRFEGYSERLAALLPELDAAPPALAIEEILLGAAAGARRLERTVDALPALPPRARNARRSLARAAVIAFALLGLGMTVSPVRAWLVERFSAVQEALLTSQPAVQETAPTLQPQSPSTVSFTPAPGAFFIDIVAAQESGMLKLTVQQGRIASAQVRGAVTDEGLLVLPDRLRITNSSTSAADYAVTLPSQLTKITVRIEGEEALSVTTAGLELPATWSFSLDGR